MYNVPIAKGKLSFSKPPTIDSNGISSDRYATRVIRSTTNDMTIAHQQLSEMEELKNDPSAFASINRTVMKAAQLDVHFNATIPSNEISVTIPKNMNALKPTLYNMNTLLPDEVHDLTGL